MDKDRFSEILGQVQPCHKKCLFPLCTKDNCIEMFSAYHTASSVLSCFICASTPTKDHLCFWRRWQHSPPSSGCVACINWQHHSGYPLLLSVEAVSNVDSSLSQLSRVTLPVACALTEAMFSHEATFPPGWVSTPTRGCCHPGGDPVPCWPEAGLSEETGRRQEECALGFQRSLSPSLLLTQT